MRLLSLHLQGFRSHEDLVLDLGSLEAAAIIGRNGAGKSSLLVAIDFACNGSGGAEDHLRDGADRMRVTLEVDQAGERWRIVRGRHRGKGGLLTLERMESGGWESWTRRTISETQALIEEHVTGMSAEAFSATVYAPQGQAGMLAALTPARRKDLLGGLLGLDRYGPWRQRAAEDGRAARARCEALDAEHSRTAVQRDELAARTEQPDAVAGLLTDAEKAAQQAATDVDRAVDAERIRGEVRLRASLARQLAGIEQRAREAERTDARRTALTQQLASLDGAADDLARAEAAHRDMQAEYARLVAEHAGHERRARELRERAEQLRRSATTCDGNARGAQDAVDRHTAALAQDDPAIALEQCPTCRQPIDDPEHRAAVEERRAAERARVERDLAKAVEARDEFAQQAAEAREQADRAEAEAASAEAPGPPPEPVDDASLCAARERASLAQRLAGEIAGLGDPQDIDALRAEYADVKARMLALPEVAPDAPEVSAARAAQATADRQVQALRERLAVAREQNSRLANLDDELRRIERERPDVDRQARALDVLARAFGPAGIPALILDNAVGAVEAAANELLETLETPLRVTLATQREKKGGGMAETLDIVVDDGQVERPLEMFSGGEKHRVYLALRLGLASALSRAGGPRCDVILLDEPSDLDAEGMRRLGEMLATWPSQCLAVTHTDELTHAMPSTITVERAPHEPSRVVVA